MTRFLTLLFFLAGAASAYPIPSEKDWFLPSEAPVRRAQPLRRIAGSAFGQGERVDYFGLARTRFAGRHVAILLPDSWMGETALTEEDIERFVDRTDLTYEIFREWIGKEPSGTGLLEVVVVPEGQYCGSGAWGCAVLDGRGVWIVDAAELRPQLWDDIKADKPPMLLVHELAHNFDVYLRHLSYVPDHAHAWTAFAQFYFYVYSREGTLEDSPEEFLRTWMAVMYEPYRKDPQANWADCLRDNLCEDRGIWATTVWGGLSLRVAQLHGPQAAHGFMRFVLEHTNAPPGESAEEKSDLHIEALSAGAGLNLACYADELSWYLSPELRARLADRHGTRNPFCEDADGDGYTPFQGDCDDASASVHEGVKEIPNGKDDDCDGIIDGLSDVWPLPPWGQTAAVQVGRNVFALAATAGVAGEPASIKGTPTEVRFWVDGVGLVGSAPYAPHTSLLWSPPAGFEGPRSFRAQAMAGAFPASSFTPAREFEVLAPCEPGAGTLCLNGGRFKVEAAWETGDRSQGPGRAVKLTDETGYFWFFDSTNVEVVVKVLDACSLGNFWVFAAGLTNVKAEIEVTDTYTGAVKRYENQQGTKFQPIQDTSAFNTCGVPRP